jgi:hypothetical protein
VHFLPPDRADLPMTMPATSHNAHVASCFPLDLNRRQMIGQLGGGAGLCGLLSALASDAGAGLRPSHAPGRAKGQPWDTHNDHDKLSADLARDIDHERLTDRYAGRDFRLTDVEGRVIHESMA